MDIKGKLEFINNYSSMLNPDDLSLINMIYKNLNGDVTAKKEDNEVLKDALYSYNDLKLKTFKLRILSDNLYDYLREKGLSQSMLKMDELINLIQSDIKITKEYTSISADSIDGIRNLINLKGE